MAYLTEDRVTLMINDALRQWEKEYGDIRHAENTMKFEALYEVLNKAKGAVWTVGLLLGGLMSGFKVFEIFHK